MNKRQATTDAAARLRARITTDLAPALAGGGAEATPQDHAEAQRHFRGPLGDLVQGRGVLRLPVGQTAPDLRADHRQLRMLPLPDVLLAQDDHAARYRDLRADLARLGHSLQAQQIQPIVVYRGTSSHYPAAQYLILVGQRRWTAAVMVGLDTLDAIVVDEPDALDRVRLQYAENEAREDFTDMERAWTIEQTRQALGGEAVAMDAVAVQLGLKRARAYQLRRLLAFTPTQQQTIATLRLQETQIRPLTEALHRATLTTSQIDMVLDQLVSIAVARSDERAGADEGLETTMPGRSGHTSGIEGTTVARIVARAVAAATAEGPAAARVAPPRWYTPLQKTLATTTAGMQRSVKRVAQLDIPTRQALHAEITTLQTALDQMTTALDSAADDARAHAHDAVAQDEERVP